VREQTRKAYQPGCEQYTLFTWAGGAPDRLADTIDNYSLRKHMKHMCLIGVGLTGLPDPDPEHHNQWEVITVASPLIWHDGFCVTGDPVIRTLTRTPSYGRQPFDFNKESSWATLSAFLAEQLLALLEISEVDRMDQYPQLVGAPAVRCPQFVVRVDSGVTADGAPQIPQFASLDALGADSIAAGPDGDINIDHIMFEVESMGHAYDIRGVTPNRPAMFPCYGSTPWFVIPNHIRATRIDFEGIRAFWVTE
jgi:hypothetical protein